MCRYSVPKGVEEQRYAAEMDINQFWKSRTLGEVMGQGYAFLRLTCKCGRITDYPFTLLLQRKGVSRNSFLGNIPFRCQKCGNAEPIIGVTRQRDAPLAGSVPPSA